MRYEVAVTPISAPVSLEKDPRDIRIAELERLLAVETYKLQGLEQATRSTFAELVDDGVVAREDANDYLDNLGVEPLEPKYDVEYTVTFKVSGLSPKDGVALDELDVIKAFTPVLEVAYGFTYGEYEVTNIETTEFDEHV
ncbi:hypothetical protein [Actinocorallia libanotica]|uniref:Uncharacterized protein n=1 Tax=Actinocorallia libanotica TaxID=46162 RepID=A0ABN1QR46_9ACTN